MITMKSEEYIDANEAINVYEYDQFNHVELHKHDFIEVVYITSGSCTHMINNSEYTVERGDILLLNIGDSHSFAPDGSVSVINILIDPQFIDGKPAGQKPVDLLALTSYDEFDDKIGELPPQIRIPAKYLLDIETIMKSMIFEFNEKSIGYKTVLRGYLNVLMARLLRIVCQAESNPVNMRNNLRDTFPAIIEYIERNYHSKITLSELARNSFFNPSYFGQVFKDSFGMTPMEYVNRKRITEAARILKENDSSVEQVCYMVGYKDKKQFYKLFKSYTGQTPGQFRKK
jgi:AraC family transcriptional regulator, L-rhamnose operon transcriptional activator RhaR